MPSIPRTLRLDTRDWTIDTRVRTRCASAPVSSDAAVCATGAVVCWGSDTGF